MNQIPVIVHNPAYVEEVELDEDEVDPADHTPLVSGNTPIVTVPASEDENVAEDVVEDRVEDEEMEDVPQILWDVIVSLAELNKEIRNILSLTLEDTGSHQSPVKLSPMLRYGTQGRLGSMSTDCILNLVEKRSDCPTRCWICSGSCTNGSTSKPGIIEI